MRSKKYIALLVSICLSLQVAAQTKTSFPAHYFRNPLNIPILLAGGFGECRPNHFHTGIDIKTEDKENLPVHAAASGYVSRISISSTGYGNALYINHPNGYTTVYGHLNKFYPKLQKWVIEQQYKQKSWKIQLYPDPNQFPVKKGQVIALSGATGGVTGPHLHFEIRNTATEHVLNELLFGLSYRDNIPPHAQSIALYNGEKSIYMQSPQIIKLKRIRSGQYEALPTEIICPAPKIFIGIHAEDYMNGSNNWMGIYRMKLFMDSTLQAETLLQELDFGLARYANAYADYKIKKDRGIVYQGLYKLPNDRLHVYPFMNSQDGKLDIKDGKQHQIKIELYDPKGNKTTVQFSVKYDRKSVSTDTATCKDGFFWSYNEPHHFKDSVFSFRSNADAFYDDICFKYAETLHPEGLSADVQVSNMDIPIQKSCEIGLKLNQKIPLNLQSKIAFVHHVKPTRLPGNNPQTGMAADFDYGWAKARVRTFGNYYCVIDTVPPEIISYQSSEKAFPLNQAIRFKAMDDITSVATFNGYLDGHWLRFVRRGDTYTYRIDSHCPVGNHVLEIQAVDENNNERNYTYKFSRR